MKSIEEIQTILVFDLLEYSNSIKSIKPKGDYYNESLGSVSFLLAGLLGSLFKKNVTDWDSNKWIDDSLLKNVKAENNILSIAGVMIWGKENTTKQWTDPFHFEIELMEKQKDFKKLTFLFCDSDKPAISYEDFKFNRYHWHKTNRNWRYILNSENKMAERL